MAEKMVGVAGFEPATPCSQSRCSSQTEPHPDIKLSNSVNIMLIVIWKVKELYNLPDLKKGM